MKLSALFQEFKHGIVGGSADPDIKGIAYDSRLVKAGYLFFALRGQRSDGNLFITDAVERGAAAVVSDAPKTDCPPQAVFVPVENARLAMAAASCAFFGNPSRDLKVVGITGTNGKTTVAFMLRGILAAAGKKTGMIGTIRYEIGDRIIPAQRTTPESPDIQNMMAQMLRVQCEAAVMEVSSHALVQHRVAGIDFDIVVFTNLTHDHLDYHGGMEDYFKAKSLLFQDPGARKKNLIAVINLDDPWGLKLAAMMEKERQLVTYGTDPAAMVRAKRVELNAGGSVISVASPWGEHEISLRLLGRFNVNNALAAFACCGALGVEVERAAGSLSEMDTVPGRLEKIKTGTDFSVFADYAHTEDALKNVLTTLREITRNRLIVVFGCGGNRDRKKRPLMGAAAASLADYVILTSDNPRKERPSDIIEEIKKGFQGRDNYEVVEDRRAAIEKGLAIARAGDVLLIAGKGHENYQELADRTIPFDDCEVVRRILGV